MAFDKKSFIEFAMKNSVADVRSEPITLASGRGKAPPYCYHYVNWRPVYTRVSTAEELANYIIDLSEDNKIDVDSFVGIPEGATLLGGITTYLHAKRSGGDGELISIRKKPKDHGLSKDRHFVGHPEGKRIVLIEDVTTTGNSTAKDGLLRMKDVNCKVEALVVLTNRMEYTPIPGRDDKKLVEEFEEAYEQLTGERYREPMSVREFVEKCGVAFLEMSNINDLLSARNREKPLSSEEIRRIDDYFKEYCITGFRV